MKLTFNILNQLFGQETPHAALINALSYVPHQVIEDSSLPAGFVCWQIAEKQALNAFSYLGVTFAQVVPMVVDDTLKGNAREQLTHGREISQALIPFSIKASEALLDYELPLTFPQSQAVELLDGQEQIRQKTLREWMTSNVVPISTEPGVVVFPFLKGTRYPSLEACKALFDLFAQHAEFNAEIMSQQDVRDYNATFEPEI